VTERVQVYRGRGEGTRQKRGTVIKSIKFDSLDNFNKESKTAWIRHNLGISQTELSKTCDDIDTNISKSKHSRSLSNINHNTKILVEPLLKSRRAASLSLWLRPPWRATACKACATKASATSLHLVCMQTIFKYQNFT
jgi:hypothetical protein